MGSSLKKLDDKTYPFALSLRHYWVYQDEEQNKRQMEIFDIVKDKEPDTWLASVYKIEPFESGIWCVTFIADGYKTSGGVVSWEPVRDDGTPKTWTDKDKAIKWAIEQIFINAL
jgi:hypothetical protein